MSVRAKVEMYERRNSQPDEVDSKPDAADMVSCVLGNPVCRQSLLACAAAVRSGVGLCCYFDCDQPGLHGPCTPIILLAKGCLI